MDVFFLYLSFLIGIFILYYLAVAYIGVSISIRKTALPILTISVLTYFFRIILQVPAVFNVLIIFLLIIILLSFVNKVAFLLSLSGALLSLITIGLGSIMLAAILLLTIGFKFSGKLEDPGWLFYSYCEYILPVIMLFILKYKKISIVKYLR